MSLATKRMMPIERKAESSHEQTETAGNENSPRRFQWWGRWDLNPRHPPSLSSTGILTRSRISSSRPHWASAYPTLYSGARHDAEASSAPVSSLARLRPLDPSRRLEGPTDARLTKCQYKDTGQVTELPGDQDFNLNLDLTGRIILLSVRCTSSSPAHTSVSSHGNGARNHETRTGRATRRVSCHYT